MHTILPAVRPPPSRRGFLAACLPPTVMAATVLSFFSSRRRHPRLQGGWSSDVCSSDLTGCGFPSEPPLGSGSWNLPWLPPFSFLACLVWPLSGFLPPFDPPPDRKSTRLNSSHLVISY